MELTRQMCWAPVDLSRCGPREGDRQHVAQEAALQPHSEDIRSVSH